MTGLLRQRTLFMAAFLLSASTVRGAVPNPKTAGGDSASSPSADTVRAALLTEASGDNSARKQLLERALSDNADDAAARWQLGYVRAGQLWIPHARELDSIAGRRQILFAYQQSRATSPDSVPGHLSLANLAREHGLIDEERAHLRRVVALDWNHEEARSRLGDVRVEGFWVTREEIIEFARELDNTRIQRNAWDARVQSIVRRLFSSQQPIWGSVWQQLTAIHDPAAIPSVEAALGTADERAALWYLDWLDGVGAWEASVALARQAILAPSATIRAAAQSRLKARRLDAFVPGLLSALRADPETASRLFVTRYGGLMYVQHLAVETQHDVRVRNLAVLYGPEISFNSFELTWRDATFPGTGSLADYPELQALALRHLRWHYGAISSREGRDLVLAQEMQNGRIARTLSTVTGRHDLKTPTDCWQWWSDEQEVYSTGQKPRLQRDYEEYWTVDRQRGGFQSTPGRSVAVIYYSCFAAGTPVVTEFGPRSIEQIQLGDRVLSQDVETGELAFKPVFQTTVRPPVQLMRISTDRGELVCTGGHPFWVNGESWLYARELQPGMRFHSVDGASEIISVEDAGREDKAYNLVVADFHTYFVGDGKILSHDNTPRAPTNALVPGLMPDYGTTLAKQ